MTTLMKMEKDRSHMTERMLNLTLEIITLLIGESFPPVKSGDQITITVPPLHSFTPELNSKKILEVADNMIELLTGQVPLYFSMEFLKLLEEQNDLFKDIIMENQLPFASPGNGDFIIKEAGKAYDSKVSFYVFLHRVILLSLYGLDFKVESSVPDTDGSSNRNPLERCSRPLNFQDSRQEDLTIPHYFQVGGVWNIKRLNPLTETVWNLYFYFTDGGIRM
ncbi:uncharacterized protein [Aquarana catesbeiana]|uniref:uncharacterized protein n=1 Tax=Aquarana catesbeiana TaxID=8400 RepID=UPI003CCA19F9